MARKRKNMRQQDNRDIRDSRLFSVSTKLGLSIFIAVVFLTLVQCTIKKPEAPEWNTQLTVPIVNRTYPMEEIVRKIDQEGIRIDADSNVIYEINEDIDTITLDADNLTTDNLSYGFSEQLGLIDIDAPSVPPVIVSFASITGLSAGVVPPSSFQVSNDIPPVSTFSSATLANGLLWIHVTNNLGIDLDTVVVDLIDVVYGMSIGMQVFPGGLDDGETDSVSFDLSGRTVSNQFRVVADCHTTGGTVLSASGKEMVTAVEFVDNLQVSTATAAVKAATLNFSETVDLQESDPVYEANLTSGQLQLTVTNNTALDATLDITLPDLVLGSTPLTINQPVLAMSNAVIPVDLTGYSLRPSDSTLPQALAVSAVATIPGSGGSHVTVNQTDQFQVSADLTNLQFSSVTGRFSSTAATIDPTTEEIDVPKGFDSLQLVNAILTIEVENGVNLPGTVTLTLDGSNGEQLNLNANIAPGGVGLATTTLIIDSTVADFLFPVPDQISITGTATFGDGAMVSTITANDYVFASVNIIAPLEMIIGETQVESDIESEEIEQDDIDLITDHVVEARFNYNIINHLPLGTTVSILLGPDSASVLTAPQLVVGPLAVNAAPTTAGVVSDTISSGYQAIILDSDDIRVLENDTLYIAQEIILHSTNGQAVRLTNNDFLTVQGYFEVEYRFDGDF